MRPNSQGMHGKSGSTSSTSYNSEYNPLPLVPFSLTFLNQDSFSTQPLSSVPSLQGATFRSATSPTSTCQDPSPRALDGRLCCCSWCFNWPSRLVRSLVQSGNVNTPLSARNGKWLWLANCPFVAPDEARRVPQKRTNTEQADSYSRGADRVSRCCAVLLVQARHYPQGCCARSCQQIR